MQKWTMISKLPDNEFRRLTGVKIKTFKEMIRILSENHFRKKARGGRENKLTIEDMLLMTLEYLREYRTYFRIGLSYGVSESNAYKIIKWTEDTLIQSKIFSLPGRKALLKSDNLYEIILVDASESPIQRPKKTKKILFGQEKKTYDQKSNSR